MSRVTTTWCSLPPAPPSVSKTSSNSFRPCVTSRCCPAAATGPSRSARPRSMPRSLISCAACQAETTSENGFNENRDQGVTIDGCQHRTRLQEWALRRSARRLARAAHRGSHRPRAPDRRPAPPSLGSRRAALHDMIEDMAADIASGHNIIATVYVDCRSMYRAHGPEALRPVGEVEFANGVAAMSASGGYGPTAICAGIVSHVNLLLGDQAKGVLEAEIAAGNGRFRGIRHSSAWDEDPKVAGMYSN